MPQTTWTRAGLAPRTVVTALVLALLLAAAAPASAITRRQAAKKALAALGTAKGGDPAIVFGLRKALRAHARVTVRGKRVVKVARRAFFFYEDLAPFKPYRHPGRVALVAARRGEVKVSRTIVWPPRVNGRLPVFLRSRKAYRSPKYRVFFRPFSTLTLLNSEPANHAPKADDRIATVKRNVPKNITLTGSDPDGDLITF